MLDLGLKQKLAKAARELADEVEAGKGPELGFGHTFDTNGKPCCAMGHVYSRAGVGVGDWEKIGAYEEGGLPNELGMVAYPVENANDARMPGYVRAGIVRQPLPEALRDYALAVEGL